MEDLRKDVNTKKPDRDEQLNNTQSKNIYKKSSKTRFIAALVTIIVCLCGFVSATYAYFFDVADVSIAISSGDLSATFRVYEVETAVTKDGVSSVALGADITNTIANDVDGYRTLTLRKGESYVFDLTMNSTSNVKGFFYLKSNDLTVYTHNMLVYNNESTNFTVIYYNDTGADIVVQLRCAMGTVPVEADKFMHEISSSALNDLDGTDSATTPSCYNVGTRVCTYGNCNETFAYVSNHPHFSDNANYTFKINPTCTETGIINHFSCYYCKDHFEDVTCTKPIDNIVLPATGHKMASTYSHDATHHWYACVNPDCTHTCATCHDGAKCTHQANKAVHTPAYQNDEVEHWSYCSICERELSRADHTMVSHCDQGYHQCSNANCTYSRDCLKQQITGLNTKILWQDDSTKKSVSGTFYIKRADGTTVHTINNFTTQLELLPGTYYIGTGNYAPLDEVPLGSTKHYYVKFDVTGDGKIESNYFVRANVNHNNNDKVADVDTYTVTLPKAISYDDGVVNDNWIIIGNEDATGYTINSRTSDKSSETGPLYFSQEALDTVEKNIDYTNEKPIVYSFTYRGKSFADAKYFPGFIAHSVNLDRKNYQFSHWGNNFILKEGSENQRITPRGEEIWKTAGEHSIECKLVILPDSICLFIYDETLDRYVIEGVKYPNGFNLKSGLDAFGMIYMFDSDPTTDGKAPWAFDNFKIESPAEIQYAINGLNKGVTTGIPKDSAGNNLPATVSIENGITGNPSYSYVGSDITIRVTPNPNSNGNAYIVRDVYLDVYSEDGQTLISTHKLELDTIASNGANGEASTLAVVTSGIYATRGLFVIRPIVETVTVPGVKLTLNLKGRSFLDPNNYTDAEYYSLLTNTDGLSGNYISNFDAANANEKFVYFGETSLITVSTNGVKREVRIDGNGNVSIDIMYTGIYTIEIGDYRVDFEITKEGNTYKASPIESSIGGGKGCSYAYDSASNTITGNAVLQYDIVDRVDLIYNGVVDYNTLNYGELTIDRMEAFPYYNGIGDDGLGIFEWGATNEDKQIMLGSGTPVYLKETVGDVVYFEAKMFAPYTFSGTNLEWWEQQLRYHNEVTGKNNLDLGGFIITATYEEDERDGMTGGMAVVYNQNGTFNLRVRMNAPTWQAVNLTSAQIAKYANRNYGLTMAAAIDKVENCFVLLIDDGNGNLKEVLRANGSKRGSVKTFKTLENFQTNYKLDELEGVMFATKLPEVVVNNITVTDTYPKNSTANPAVTVSKNVFELNGNYIVDNDGNSIEVVEKQYLGRLVLKFDPAKAHQVESLTINGSKNLVHLIDTTGYYIDEHFTDRTVDINVVFGGAHAIWPILLTDITGGYIWEGTGSAGSWTTDKSIDGKVISVYNNKGLFLSSDTIESNQAMLYLPGLTDAQSTTNFELRVDGYYPVTITPAKTTIETGGINAEAYGTYTASIDFERIPFVDSETTVNGFVKGVYTSGIVDSTMTVIKDTNGIDLTPTDTLGAGHNDYTKYQYRANLDAKDGMVIEFDFSAVVENGKIFWPEIDFVDKDNVIREWIQLRAYSNATSTGFSLRKKGGEIIDIGGAGTYNYKVRIIVDNAYISVYLIPKGSEPNIYATKPLKIVNDYIIDSFNITYGFDCDGSANCDKHKGLKWSITNLKFNTGGQYFVVDAGSSKYAEVTFAKNPVTLNEKQVITIKKTALYSSITGVKINGADCTMVKDNNGVVTVTYAPKDLSSVYVVTVTTEETPTNSTFCAEVHGKIFQQEQLVNFNGKTVTLTNKATKATYTGTVSDVSLVIANVPSGEYTATISDTNYMPLDIVIEGRHNAENRPYYMEFGYELFQDWDVDTPDVHQYNGMPYADLTELNYGKVSFHNDAKYFFNKAKYPDNTIKYAEMNIYDPYYINPNNTFYKAGSSQVSTNYGEERLDNGKLGVDAGGTFFSIGFTHITNGAKLTFGTQYRFGVWVLRWGNVSWNTTKAFTKKQLAKFSSPEGLKIAVACIGNNTYGLVDDGDGNLVVCLTLDCYNQTYGKNATKYEGTNPFVEAIQTNHFDKVNAGVDGDKEDAQRDLTQVWDKITNLKLSTSIDIEDVAIPVNVTSNGETGTGTNKAYATSEGGTVSVSAKLLNKTTIVVSPKAGYYLSAITVNGSAVNVSEFNDGYYEITNYGTSVVNSAPTLNVVATFTKTTKISVTNESGTALTGQVTINGTNYTITDGKFDLQQKPLSDGEYVVSTSGKIPQTLRIESGVPDKMLIKFPADPGTSAVSPSNMVLGDVQANDNDKKLALLGTGSSYGQKLYRTDVTTAGSRWRYPNGYNSTDVCQKFTESKYYIISFDFITFLPKNKTVTTWPAVCFRIKNSAGNYYNQSIQIITWGNGTAIKDLISERSNAVDQSVNIFNRDRAYDTDVNLSITMVVPPDKKSITVYVTGTYAYNGKVYPTNYVEKVINTTKNNNDDPTAKTFDVVGLNSFGFGSNYKADGTETPAAATFDNLMISTANHYTRINVPTGYGAELKGSLISGHGAGNYTSLTNLGGTAYNNNVLASSSDADANVSIHKNNTIFAGDNANLKGYPTLATYGSKKEFLDIAVVYSESNVNKAFSKTGGNNFYLRDYKSDTEAFTRRVSGLEQSLSMFTHDKNELVIFAGDSFMDERWFFTDFYDRFDGKNAYLAGISSSRASHWKFFGTKLLYPFNPKAVVMHIGTNDIFDGAQSGNDAANSIIDMFEAFHANLPNTTFYWYSIANRIGQADAKKTDILNCNQIMRQYSASNPWLVYMELRNEVSYSNGTPNPDYYKKDPNTGSQDNVHLNVKGYDVMQALLENTGLNITENMAQKAIDNGQTPTNYVGGTASMVSRYTYGGKTREQVQKNWDRRSVIGIATGKFVYTADLTFNKLYSNPHISFSFSNRLGQRLLLWDNDSNSSFHFGGQVGRIDGRWGDGTLGYNQYNTNTTDTYNYSAQNNKLTISVYYDGINAYMYGDGDMKAMIVNVQHSTNTFNWFRESFEVTAEGCNVDFSNVRVIKGGVGIDKWIESTTDNSKELLDRFSRRGNVFVNLEGSSVNTGQNDQQIAENRFFDVKNTANLPTIGRHVAESTFTITDTDKTSSRSYIYLHDGNKMIKGDWTASFKFRRLSSEFDEALAEGFFAVSVTHTGHVYPWYSYTTCYKKMKPQEGDYFYISNDDGRTTIYERPAGAPGSALLPEINDIEVVVVKTDTRVYTSYIFEYYGQTYTYVIYADYQEMLMRKSTLYFSLEKMTVEISNFNLSQDSSDVASALSRIGK